MNKEKGKLEGKFNETGRLKVARKVFLLAWCYFSLYLLVLLGSSYLLGTKPYLFGLPRWVAIGNIVVPLFFVILLIFVAERFIPDIPLTDDDGGQKEERR
ncbi:MAG: DUF997 family protein [Acidobacteria bacterium]|nr:DUF997 family protein [Acidobacteriota bacterium]